MSEKSTLLPLPAAIDAAYLLLIGQLCISLSKLLFGFAFAFEGNVQFSPNLHSSIIWCLSVVITVMLFINIISCWKSTRATFDEIGHYPNSLLTSDIYIIVSFFFLNSIAAAPLGFMQNLVLDTQGIQKFLEDISKLWNPVIPLLFFASAVLVVSYKVWNKAYYSELEKGKTEENSETLHATKIELEKFNSLYTFMGLLFVGFGIMQFLFDQFYMTLTFLLVWISFWSYVNFSWVFAEPTSSE